jgi:hypothetical protein
MNQKLISMLLAAVVGGSAGAATPATLEPMPEKLEMQFALSALPPALRDAATVHVLDPARGYRVARSGTSGTECLVERTVWEMAEFRNDVFIPMCYDAAGIEAHFKVILDTATLRARGMSAEALKAEVEKRYRDKTYRVPEKAGLSYMIAPLMRVNSPPDMKLHTMSMPHLMFYAPFITNKDLGAVPDLANPASLAWPFIDRQGNDEQSYMIQLVGAAEKAEIMAREKPLIDALCRFRAELCLTTSTHAGH